MLGVPDVLQGRLGDGTLIYSLRGSNGSDSLVQWFKNGVIIQIASNNVGIGEMSRIARNVHVS